MGTSAIHHFLRQASTEEQLCSQTHTQSRVRLKTCSRFFLERGLNQSCFRPLAELEPDSVTATLVTGNPQIINGANSKPGLMFDFAASVHSHKLALNYRGFGGRVVSSLTSNVHPPHRGSQIAIQAWCRDGSSCISTCQFFQAGICLLLQCLSWLLHLSPPQHLF